MVYTTSWELPIRMALNKMKAIRSVGAHGGNRGLPTQLMEVQKGLLTMENSHTVMEI